MFTLRELIEMPEAQLAGVDPIEMNLVVARGIPALAQLDIPSYQELADGWAEGVERNLEQTEPAFWREPWDWDHDISLFRLGQVCFHLEQSVRLRYRDDQRTAFLIDYTDPCDLFVNGVMDTLQGTCGNMGAVYVGVCYRLGYPVSLACAGFHYLCRYDDGRVTYNIEPTCTGKGGFSNPPDDYYQQFQYTNSGLRLPVRLKAFSPRELLGAFVGLRARHYQDTGFRDEAWLHYRLAHHLCPVSSLHEVKARTPPGVASVCISPAVAGTMTMYGWGEVYVSPLGVGVAPGRTPAPPSSGRHERAGVRTLSQWRSLDITEREIEELCPLREPLG